MAGPPSRKPESRPPPKPWERSGQWLASNTLPTEGAPRAISMVSCQYRTPLAEKGIKTDQPNPQTQPEASPEPERRGVAVIHNALAIPDAAYRMLVAGAVTKKAYQKHVWPHHPATTALLFRLRARFAWLHLLTPRGLDPRARAMLRARESLCERGAGQREHERACSTMALWAGR